MEGRSRQKEVNGKYSERNMGAPWVIVDAPMLGGCRPAIFGSFVAKLSKTVNGVGER
ncbi:hypothetical protein D3C73_1594890 [compost metagenome]